MNARPRIAAEITFLSTAEGGRAHAPILNDGRYMPHIVIGSPEFRRAAIDPDGVCREDYLGVRFIDGPPEYRLGEKANVLLDLMYYPNVCYDDCTPAAMFTIREGGRVVGSGRILSRTEGS